MKQVLTVVAVMLLLAMPCRAAGEPEQVEGLDELWQAAESYGVEPDGDLSGGLSGLAEQALGQAGELLRRSAQTGLKLLAVAVFCGLAERMVSFFTPRSSASSATLSATASGRESASFVTAM